jgi:hypothetical protein
MIPYGICMAISTGKTGHFVAFLYTISGNYYPSVSYMTIQRLRNNTFKLPVRKARAEKLQ